MYHIRYDFATFADRTMSDKKRIHQACLQLLEDKISSLQSALDDLTSGVESESKSSAGDKHETGRAMVQIEQARIGKQLSELLMQHQILRSIDPEKKADFITNGSLVRVKQGLFYISVALGKVDVDGELVMTLSPASPLGTSWQGAKTNQIVTFNGTSYTILEVL